VEKISTKGLIEEISTAIGRPKSFVKEVIRDKEIKKGDKA